MMRVSTSEIFVDLSASYEFNSGLCIASSCLSVVSLLCVAYCVMSVLCCVLRSVLCQCCVSVVCCVVCCILCCVSVVLCVAQCVVCCVSVVCCVVCCVSVVCCIYSVCLSPIARAFSSDIIKHAEAPTR